MKKRLIGMVSSFAHPHQGGVEVYSWELAKRMEQEGHQVIYISLNTEKQQSEEEREGIYCFKLPCAMFLGGKLPIPKFNNEYWYLMKKIMKFKYDLLFLNVRFYPFSFIFANLAKRRQIPALLVEHGTGHFEFSSTSINRLAQIYEHLITECIKRTGVRFYGVSQACIRWLEHFGIKGEGIIYNGVNARQVIKPLVDLKATKRFASEFHVCFVGRLIDEKGVTQLVEAVQKLHETYPRLILYIAGDGPLKERFPKSVEYVQYLGKLPREDIFALFNSCDAMVLPSRFPEGLPTTILEAGSQACSVIATAMGGTKEVILNGEYGIIIPDGSVKSIQAALKFLIENPAVCKQMGDKLQQRVISEFDWDAIYRKFSIEVLDTLN